MTFWSVLCLCLLASFPAHAHVAVAGSEGFVIGLTQPFLEIDVGIAAAAMGLALGQRTRDLNERAAGLFLIGLLIGLGAVFLPVRTDLPREFVYGVSLAAGLLIAAAHAPAKWLSLPFSFLGGLLIGLGSGPEPASISAIAFTAGGSLVCITFLFMYGLAGSQWMTSPERPPWLSVALRVIGSWIVAISLLVIALSGRG